MLKKRALLVIALVLIGCCLMGCGTPKEVPEQILKWEIEDYLKSYKDQYGDWTEYTNVVSHQYNKDTKTDSVALALNVTYSDFTANANYEATYQYDKSSDLWNRIRGDGWTVLKSSNVMSPISEDWIRAFEKMGLIMSDYIPDTSTQYDDAYIANHWQLASGDEGVRIAFYEFTSEDIANQYYEEMQETLDVLGNTTNSKNETDYAYRSIVYKDKTGEYTLLRQYQYVCHILSSGINGIRHLDQILSDIGFVFFK